MGATTKIAWTDHTFNPWIGCTKVSAGCAHCYAETFVRNRMGLDRWGNAPRVRTKGPWREVRKWNRAALADGVRRRVFCASLCDVFEDAPGLDEIRADLWPLIKECSALDWQLLTKRPENIARMLPADWGSGWPHVWLGTSVESQEAAPYERILRLLKVPAAVRFLSCEPLLGPIKFGPYTLTERPCFVCKGEDECGVDRGAWSHPINCGWRRDSGQPDSSGIDWVIVGGESGPGFRPMSLAWAQSLREQCRAAGVAFFFKQASGPRSGMGDDALGEVVQEFPR